MDYITYQKEEWPLRVSYYALKQYQKETGTIMRSTSDLSPLEIWLIQKLIDKKKES